MNARLSSLLVAGAAVLVAPASLTLVAGALEAPTVRALSRTGSEGQAQILVSLTGATQAPRVDVLPRPNRVVIDLPGVLMGSQVGRKDVVGLTGPLVHKARMAQFATAPAPVTRLVLEVADGTQVAVRTSPEGLVLDLQAGSGQVHARMTGEAPAMPVLHEAAPAPKVETEIVTAQATPAPVKPLSSLPSVGGGFTVLPQIAAATLLPVASPEAAAQEPKPAAAQAPTPVAPTRNSSRTIGDKGSRYTGAKITIDLQNTDLVQFLRLLAETGKLNLVVDNDVQGTYNFKFVDTPWDQVLDVILKNAALGKEIDNGVLRVAKIEKLQKEEEDRKKLEEAKALAGELQTITRPLSYAKVAEVSKIAKDLLTKRGSVIIDERTNTLIVTDLPRNIPVLDELIQTLDVQIAQVQIEARVVEASKGWDREFGVKWPTSNNGDTKLSVSDSTGKTIDAPWSQFGNGPSWNSLAKTDSTGRAYGAAYSGGRDGVTSITNPAGEFWFSFLSDRFSINAVLQALEKDNVVKVVSSPKVVTQNNKKATILSGEKVPFPAQQGGAAGGAITVQFVDANLQLDVTPQITSEGTIIMDLKLEKAQADFSRTVLGTPTIQRKSLETQVLVRDGGTAVLGGVYITSNQVGSTGVPFLKNLPILGWLFKNKITKEDNAELLIFITPRIVRQ